MSNAARFEFEDAPALAPDAFVAALPVGLSSSRALLEALCERLALPSYFGFNWDALSDCLRDLHWIDKSRVVLQHVDLPQLPEAELRIYIDVLAESVQSWQPGEPHTLRVIFPESARARLQALTQAPSP